jgi:hypothetical protein
MTDPPKWVSHVIHGMPRPLPGVAALLLDPHGVVPAEALEQWDRHVAPNPWEIRRQYERHVRDRPEHATAAVLHIVNPAIQRSDQLPWDISRLTTATVDPAIPAPLLAALPFMADDLAMKVVTAARTGIDAGALIATALLGISLPSDDPAVELLAAARAHELAVASPVRELMRSALRSELASDAMGSPSHDGPLVSGYADWLKHGSRSHFHDAFTRCGPSLQVFVDAGILPPATDTAPGIPGWLRDAGADADATGLLHSLLDQRPTQPARTLEDWASIATWWARVRRVCATGRVSEHGVTEAWATWDALDEEFQHWLVANYADQLTRSHIPPRTVDKITHFLAYRRTTSGRPQLLVVMDGMAIGQWNQLSAAAGVRESERHLVLAAIPTITNVSRQAIFAGTIPSAFATRLRSPAEERLWQAFWQERGLDGRHVVYARADGWRIPDIPADAQAVGIVVNAVDDAMHAVGNFDDPGLADLVTRFAEKNVVGHLTRTASLHGWDLWFTSDHGNLSCRGLDQPVTRPGLTVMSRGQRVWTYQSDALRAEATVPGRPWDPPGYPQEGGYPLFAVGRTCYHRGGSLVSHGGLSLDEVFVPLVRVET